MIRVHRFYALFGARLALVATLTVVGNQACGDLPTSADSPRALGVPSRTNAVTDPSLNYNDTWVSATETFADTATVSSDQAFTDPVTDQQTTSLTLASDPQNVDVLAGYGYDGQLRVTSGYAASNAAETQIVQQVGDATGDADLSGQTSTQPLEIEPTAQLGTLTDAQVDPSSGSGGVNCHTADGSSCVATAIRMASDQSAPTEIRQEGNRLTVIQSFRAGVPRTSIVSPSKAPVSRSSLSPLPMTGQARRTSRLTREYEHRGGRWLLKHVLNEATVDGPHGSISQRQHLSITRMESHQNPVLDAARAARRATIDTNSVAPTASQATIRPEVSFAGRTVMGVSSVVAADSDASPGTGGSNPGFIDPPAPDDGNPQNVNTSTNVGGDGPAVVFQHGFYSSAQTFGRMDAWIRNDMAVSKTIARSLSWDQSYENQAANLHYLLRSQEYLPGPVILIGHSNGGMVSRYLGRHPAAYNETGVALGYPALDIRGVITIGTPHVGAPSARYARDLAYLIGFGGAAARVVCAFVNGAGCARFGQLYGSTFNTYVNRLYSPIPVLSEMQPNDSYHANFNAALESFDRFGIQSYAWERWRAWGLWGDLSACYPESNCGGRAQVKKTDRIYHHDISCAIVGIFTMRWAAAAGCALDAAFLNLVDGLTRRFLSPGEKASDGIVPRSSQLYPGLPPDFQYQIDDGDSHVGETKSRLTGRMVERILRERFAITQARFSP
jgi:pimeloyl-ACP methyl ester carboxylesterase